MDWGILFEYRNGDPYWKIKRSSQTKLDQPAGFYDDAGYRLVKIKEVGIKKVHRIIWEMFNGPIPDGMEIDHINRIRDDNRIENLRLVNKSLNAFNADRRKSNRYTGVHFNKLVNKFQVRISFEKKRYHVGYFITEEEAVEAYNNKKKELHKDI